MKTPVRMSDWATLWFQAPQVITQRLMQLSTGPLSSAKSQAEMTRMVSEKASAMTESMIAAQLAIGREVVRAATMPFDGLGAQRVSDASIKPYATRVRANAKRLKKRTKT